ncbi:MAG: SLBB domain-containing protein [Candidatus Eisenbacteria bacterium]
MRSTACLAILLVMMFAGSAAGKTGLISLPAGAPDSLARPSVSRGRPILEGPISAESYVLGPGDELEIGFWKEMDRRQIVRIEPEGFALTSPVGPIELAGLSLQEAKGKIRAALAPFYREEDLSVSLYSLRSFVVHVVGSVPSPGPKEVFATQRVSEAIEAAGGLFEAGSSRNILVRRRDGGFQKVDLVAYRNTGDLSKNPFMRDGDVIVVPVATHRVSVYGAVGRPGIYELVEGETIGDLVEVSGGPLEGLDRSSIELQRFPAERPDSSRELSLTLEEALRTGPGGFRLEDGDRVFFRGLRDWHRDASVELQGEFARPGRYVIQEGQDRVLDVLARAGGRTKSAAPEEAKLLRTLFEEGGSGVDKEVRFLVGQQTDKLTPEDYEFLKTFHREDYSRLVIDLEGLFLREDSTQNHLLRDGDVVVLPTRVDMVRISGRVVSPGLVPFQPGRSYRQFIEDAGGFDRAADRGKVRLIKKRSGARLKPGPRSEIEPGDMIWVPPKEDRDWWQIARETFAVAAQVATIYLVIDRTQ